MIIIAPIILKLTEREDRVAAGWWMETKKSAARQITQFFIHHTGWPSLLCCISMETNRLLGLGYSQRWDTRDGNSSGARVGGNQGRRGALWLVVSM